MYYTSNEHREAFLKAMKEYKAEGNRCRSACLYCLTSTDSLRSRLSQIYIRDEDGDAYPTPDAVKEAWPSSSAKRIIRLACNLFNYDLASVTPGELAEWLGDDLFEVCITAMRIRRGAPITN